MIFFGHLLQHVTQYKPGGDLLKESLCSKIIKIYVPHPLTNKPYEDKDGPCRVDCFIPQNLENDLT